MLFGIYDAIANYNMGRKASVLIFEDDTWEIFDTQLQHFESKASLSG